MSIFPRKWERIMGLFKFIERTKIRKRHIFKNQTRREKEKERLTRS